MGVPRQLLGVLLSKASLLHVLVGIECLLCGQIHRLDHLKELLENRDDLFAEESLTNYVSDLKLNFAGLYIILRDFGG